MQEATSGGKEPTGAPATGQRAVGTQKGPGGEAERGCIALQSHSERQRTNVYKVLVQTNVGNIHCLPLLAGPSFTGPTEARGQPVPTSPSVLNSQPSLRVHSLATAPLLPDFSLNSLQDGANEPRAPVSLLIITYFIYMISPHCTITYH